MERQLMQLRHQQTSQQQTEKQGLKADQVDRTLKFCKIKLVSIRS